MGATSWSSGVAPKSFLCIFIIILGDTICCNMVAFDLLVDLAAELVKDTCI